MILMNVHVSIAFDLCGKGQYQGNGARYTFGIGADLHLYELTRHSEVSYEI